MKINYKKIFYYISNISHLVFIYGVGIIMTLILHDGYFDIMETKFEAFKYIYYILLPLLLVNILLKKINKYIIIKNDFDYYILYFLFSCLISTLICASPLDAFMGYQGWYVGYFVIGSLIITYLSLKDIKFNLKLYIPLLIVILFEFILSFFDALNLDIMSLKTEFKNNSIFNFFATIGNSNWYVGFLSLVVPIFICYYLSAKNKISKSFFNILSSLGLLTCFIIGADGIYVAFSLSSFFFVPYILKNKRNLIKILYLFIEVSVLSLFIVNSNLFNRFLESLNSISRYFFRNEFLFPLLFLCVVLLLLITRINDTNYEYKTKTIIIYAEVLLLLIITSIVFFVSVNTKILNNGRFEIWELSINRFMDFSLINKLFGVGIEYIRHLYAPLFTKYNVIYNASHSEPLQLLLTAGISGLLSWLMCWFCIFKSFINKKIYKNDEYVGFFLGLITYFFQSLFNSATTLNVCFLTMLIIIVNRDDIL